MNEKDIIKQATGAILEKPFEFTLEVQPLGWIERTLMRLKLKPNRVTFVIKPTVLGARLRYSEFMADVVLDSNSLEKTLIELNHEMTVANTLLMVKALVCAINNKDEEPPQGMVRMLMNNLSSQELFYLAEQLRALVNPEVFLNSIILTKGMSLSEKVETIATPIPTTGQPLGV